MCSMRVQHEEQKHSAGWKGHWAYAKPEGPIPSPSSSPLHRRPWPGPPEAHVWCESHTLNQSRKVQSCKDRDGGKHRGGRLLETATAEVKWGWVSRGSAYQAEGTAPSVMLL